MSLLLQALREKTGDTQTEFGAKVGLNQSEVSRIERGVVKPSDDLLGRIAAALGHTGPAYELLQQVER